MKAILVIDMPKDCYGCDFCLGGSSLMYLCERTGKEFEFINGERKDFCPLKPMLSREDIYEEMYLAFGLWKEEYYVRMRNAVDKVLDEMLGEE